MAHMYFQFVASTCGHILGSPDTVYISKAKPHKSPEIPHIYYVYLLLLMSLLGSVQRKLQALQKVWQEDARRKQWVQKKTHTPLTKAIISSLATIYFLETATRKMKNPHK